MTRKPMFFFADEDIQLRPGVWVNVPAEFATARLAHEPGVELDFGTTGTESLPMPHLLIAGPADRLTGWGNLAERFIHHLAQSSYALTYMPIGFPHDHEDTSPVVKALLKRLSRFPKQDGAPVIPPHDHALVFSLPYNLPRVPAKRRILFSMYEATTFPARDQGLQWPQYVNQYADALIVPSKHQAQVWHDYKGENDARVTVPIHVCPLGVDTAVWQFVERPPRPAGTPFTVLLYGILSSRKSPVETITDVCYRAFRGLDDWRLVLKTAYGQYGAGDMGGGDFISDPHIEKINTHYTLQQMWKLCARADCGIFLSRYEGYGLPPLEMMSSGLPVILTDYSGLSDNIGVGFSNVPVAITEITPAGQDYVGLEGWGEPNWRHAAIALRREYDEWHARGRTQSPLGRMASLWVHRERTWEQATEKLVKILGEYVK